MSYIRCPAPLNIVEKWYFPPVAILDAWNSFSFAFLTISDQNITFIFFLKMAAGGHFGCPKFILVFLHFSPFLAIFVYILLHKVYDEPSYEKWWARSGTRQAKYVEKI